LRAGRARPIYSTMRALLRLVGLTLLFVASGSAATQPPGFVEYKNPRFGFALIHRAETFRPDAAAAGEDGRRFEGPNGAELRVWGSVNSLGLGLASLEADAQHDFVGGRVTFRRQRTGWLVLQGVDRDGRLLYRAVATYRAPAGSPLAGGRVVANFMVAYAEADRARIEGDLTPMLEHFLRSVGLQP
jgi:hypothetical protein